MTPASDAEDAAKIERSIRAAHPSTARPWTVVAERERGSGPWHVEVAHEASTGMGFGLGKTSVEDSVAAVLDCLRYSRHELDIVATAPPLSNPEWVRELRILSSIFNWTKTEVRAVARLVERDHLQSDEAEWLISTIGRNEPAPEPSNAF